MKTKSLIRGLQIPNAGGKWGRPNPPIFDLPKAFRKNENDTLHRPAVSFCGCLFGTKYNKIQRRVLPDKAIWNHTLNPTGRWFSQVLVFYGSFVDLTATQASWAGRTDPAPQKGQLSPGCGPCPDLPSSSQEQPQRSPTSLLAFLLGAGMGPGQEAGELPSLVLRTIHL